MSDPNEMSPYEVKSDVSVSKVHKVISEIASGLSAGEDFGKSGVAVFNPFESIVAGMRIGNNMAQMVKISSMAMARGFITPVELVFRYNFGERYFNSAVGLSVLLSNLIARYMIGVDKQTCNLMLFEVCGILFVHRILAFIRDRKGEYIHSYSEGKSWLPTLALDNYLARHNFTFDISKLILEPAITTSVGVVICFSTATTKYVHYTPVYSRNDFGTYLAITGVVMFFYQYYCYVSRRDQLLDEKDSQVISEIRERLSASSDTPGIFSHKGVSYKVFGGKKDPSE